jgi:hypothetical protein
MLSFDTAKQIADAALAEGVFAGVYASTGT